MKDGRAVLGAEPAHVHLPEVETGLALGDPFRDHAADAARAREPVRAEPRRHEEAADLGLAEAELVIGRERLRPVDQLGDLDLVHHRDAPLGVLGDLEEPIPVVLEEAPVEVGRDAIEAGGAVGEERGRAVALIAPHHQAAAVLAEVDQQVGIAKRRQPLAVLAKRLRDEILVRHRDQRHADPGETADLRGVHAGGVDDHLGLDPAALGLHRAHRSLVDVDPGHAGVLEDLELALAARDVGERVGELGGVDVAVGGQPRAAEHPVGRHQREPLARLLGGDQLQRQAEGLRPARLAAKLLHPRLTRGEPDPAALDPARIELGLGREAAIDVDRVHHHLRQRDRAAKLADQAGRVEGRARGQLGALEQDHVAVAELRQVVGDRGPPDAAADDHAAGRARQLSSRAHALPRARSRSLGAPRSRASARSAWRRSRGSRNRARRARSGRRPTSPRGSPT